MATEEKYVKKGLLIKIKACRIDKKTGLPYTPFQKEIGRCWIP
jgi:hypothetical protein